jgi:hypothetical protein
MALAFGQTDVLSLGADWEPQSDSGSTSRTRATATNGKGTIIAETTHGSVSTRTAVYIYIGALTGLAAAIDAAGANPGQAVNSLLVLSVSVGYADCKSGKLPKVSFEYTDQRTDDSRIFKPSVTLPSYAAGDPEVPTILTATLGDALMDDCTYRISCQIDPDIDKDGDIIGGETFGGEESLDLALTGVPTSITSTGWQQTSIGAPSALGNTAYPKAAYSFVKGVAPYVAP